MVGLHSLTIELDGFSLYDESQSHRRWINADRVAVRLQFSAGPPSWDFDLTDPVAAKVFYGKQCADHGGALLSVDVTKMDGREALRGLFKYRAPIPNSMAMYFVGILWVPFPTGSLQINVEALEMGTTGMREAAVMLLEGDRWPVQSDSPPEVVSSAIELFEGLRSTPRPLPSDEERYDQMFPSHPLSLVRKWLSAVENTGRLDPNVRSLEPFRIKSN